MKNAYPILNLRAPRSSTLGGCALAMMIKAPQAGSSKTRLVPPLSTHEAAALSVCFLRDTANNIAGACAPGGGAGIAVYTPLGAERAFDNLLPETFSLLPQRGEAFGERLFHAAEDLFAAGYESVCLIDSDSPTLPRVLLKQAVDALARAGDRVVLGAAQDGGYYLIGLKQAHRHVFTNIDWSTSRVFSQTVQRAAEINLEVMALPAWYDVDDAASLGRLRHELFSTNGDRLQRNDLVGYDAPHTRRYLNDLFKTRDRRQGWPVRVRLNQTLTSEETAG